jgi:diguanylate cyclase (GGDEF)-like protein
MNFRHSLNSLTTRLILMGMTLLIAGTLGRIFLLSDFLREDVNELTSAQLLTLANYAAKNVDHDIVERRDLLARVAKKFPLELMHKPKQLHKWLAECADINPLFSQGFIVLDTSGISQVDYPAGPDNTGPSYADNEYFQQALKGEFAIGRPVLDSLSKVPVLPMAMPLRDHTGKVQAVLVGISALNSPNFMEVLYATHVGNTGGLLLISPRDKLFVGSSDASMVLQTTPNEGINKLHDRAMKGFRGVGITVNARGVEELAGFASVPSCDWFVVARMPTSEAFAPVSRLRNYVLKNTFITFFIFLIIMVLVMRQVMKPLMNAARHADLMTLGEIPLKSLPVVRNDEVGHLTAAFNRMLSKLLESQANLEHVAHHDALTGLPNRHLLADRMRQALARAARSKEQVAVLFLDLDGFKPINDRLGHKAGDIVLHEVAEGLSNVMRREDTLARIGGDEFVILLSDLNEDAKNSAELVANKCIAIFQKHFVIHDQSCGLGVSIGIALSNGSSTPDSLLAAADQAMYQAKKSGRGQFSWDAT